MALDLLEVRLVALAMIAAYAAMALGAFIPAYRRRKAEAAPVRAARPVPRLVDRLWVGTQGLILLDLLGAVAVPQYLVIVPTNLSALGSIATAGAGLSVFVVGCVLVAWASRHLGAELTVAIEAREGGRLVTTGPYARVRHPIYMGVFLLVSGASVALASPLLAAYFPVAFYCARARATAEEALLASDEVHGSAYRDYVARTGRFAPAPRKPGNIPAGRPPA